MVHHRQGLAFGLEAGDDLAGVHARLHHLDSDQTPHGALLLGHVDQAHAPFADLLVELVGTDDGANVY